MNKKGISPVVAVVLLIAIAVIAAVGLYFWIGSLTGQPTTKQKPRTITASTVNCNQTGDISRVLISDTADPEASLINLTDAGMDLETSSGAPITNCNPKSITSGDTASCDIGDENATFKKASGTISIFGEKIAASEISC